MLNRMNDILQKLMPIMTPASVVIGILFYQALDNFLFLVPWIFALMTFTGSLRSNFSDLFKVMKHPFSLVITLFILHLLIPLLAFVVGNWVFPNNPYYITGLILAFVIPTGITSLIWVTIYRGNIALTLSIILLDTLLSPIVVPAVLKWLVGSSVEMNVMGMMQGLLGMIVIPSLIGMCVNQWMKKEATEKLSTTLSPFSKLGVIAVVSINSSGVAIYFKEFNHELMIVAAVMFILTIIAYGVGGIAGVLFKQDKPTTISMMYNSGMRNISAGAVLAITYFPAPVAVPIIIGMLFQQVLASLVGSMIDKLSNRVEEQSVLSQ
ncbi:bile acid:sodium symporter family protein [Bacillus carboniphilus]|uniref:Bile acid:sodium symporter family protein n=1 Tax=Bacillus carboniphilus TaxID=86663 RepID=A0ABY9JVT3_9BACI|nr:bile acid:sodium symporter family protein [Bacillus carboniphilus]WLR42572.1 bile acid:sodium symporter family protein [Bacillus carboniphilus]